MDNKMRFIECCDIAIRKGFGNYNVIGGLSWISLKQGLEEGRELSPEATEGIQKAVDQLGDHIRELSSNRNNTHNTEGVPRNGEAKE